jgi:hypothetical protein
VAAIAQLLELPHLDDDLARVEEALRTSVVTSHPFLTEVAGHRSAPAASGCGRR